MGGFAPALAAVPQPTAPERAQTAPVSELGGPVPPAEGGEQPGSGRKALAGDARHAHDNARPLLPELRFSKKHTTCNDRTLLRGPHPAAQKG